MASISSLICRFRKRLAKLASSGEPRFKLLDLDEDPKETRDEAADDEDVEQAEEDVEKGFVRRASDAFNCFLFNINLDDGDRVGEIGAEDDDCVMSLVLITSSRAVVSLTGNVTALEPGLREWSGFLKRCTAAVDGPTRIPATSMSDPPAPTLLLALLLVLCDDSLASAPLM